MSAPKKRENYGPKFYRNPTPKSFAPYKLVDFPKVPQLLLHTCWFDECKRRINPSYTLLCKFCGLRFCHLHERQICHLCQGPRFVPYPLRFKMFSDRVITTPSQSNDPSQPGTSGYNRKFIRRRESVKKHPRKPRIDGEDVEEEEGSTSSEDDDSPKQEDYLEVEVVEEDKIVEENKQEEKVHYVYLINTDDVDPGQETDDESIELNTVRKKLLKKHKPKNKYGLSEEEQETENLEEEEEEEEELEEEEEEEEVEEEEDIDEEDSDEADDDNDDDDIVVDDIDDDDIVVDDIVVDDIDVDGSDDENEDEESDDDNDDNDDDGCIHGHDVSSGNQKADDVDSELNRNSKVRESMENLDPLEKLVL